MTNGTATSNNEVESLYRALLDAWNRTDAAGFASLFLPEGQSVGFDGSEMDGAEQIRTSLEAIFADHRPATYVGKVRSVHVLSAEAALLRAVAGMVPPQGSDLNENLAIQSLVAVRRDGGWRIALWHNTPAAFHGRPEDRAALMDELRQLVPG
jgi:uncharacterized protein (TIGR02246 family)